MRGRRFSVTPEHCGAKMTKQPEKTIIHLVPSAHWDREWYLSFPRFQVRLVRLIDKVMSLLENDIYPCYLLDGQSVMIEDYLAVKPQNESRLKMLISSGKLVIGPWYTVPDTFLPCGESLLKNLETGMEIRVYYGGKGKVAYTPDSFGLNSQFAQIVAKYGMEYVYFSRGERLENEALSGKKSDVILRAKDGTSLIGECDKYSTGSGLVVPGIWKNFEKYKVEESDAVRCTDWTFDYQSTRTAYKNRLWICGTDHLEPREDLPEIAEFLNKTYKNAEFKLSTTDSFFEAVSKENPPEKPYIAVGEQRGNYDKHYELSNTLSSRPDVKLLNREAENLLFGTFESLDIFAGKNENFGYFDRRAIAEHAYKELLKSHAHDSICTCGSEEMCEDEKNRLRGVKEVALELIKDDLSRIGSSLKRINGGGELLLFNPLPYDRKEVVEGYVSVPYDVDGNKLTDENGRVIEDSFVRILFKKRIDIETMKYTSFKEISTDETRTFIPENAGKEDIQTGIYYRFTANVKALSFARYGFCSAEEKEIATKPDEIISNELLNVNVSADGSLVITNKDGVKAEFYPVIDVDDGDSYTYANKEAKPPKKADKVVIEKAAACELYSQKEVKYVFENVGLNKKSVELCLNIRLENGDDKAKITAKVTNDKCYGFRLGLVEKIDGQADYIYADTPFDLVKRPIPLKKDLSKDIFTCSMRDVSYIPQKNGSVAVFSKSFHEYEAWKTQENEAFARYTLLRSTEKVYDTFLPTKDESGAGKGMRWQSESLKMLGKNEFEFAVKLYRELKPADEILTDALKYQHPLVVKGVAPDGKTDIASLKGFSLDGAVFSRVIEREGNGKRTIFARVFNPCENDVTATLRYEKKEIKVDLPAGKIEEIDLKKAFGKRFSL